MAEYQYYYLVKSRPDELLQEAEGRRRARSMHPHREKSLLYRCLHFLNISGYKILQNRYSLRVLSAVGMKLSTN